jgi:hypothetical protein
VELTLTSAEYEQTVEQFETITFSTGIWFGVSISRERPGRRAFTRAASVQAGAQKAISYQFSWTNPTSGLPRIEAATP